MGRIALEDLSSPSSPLSKSITFPGVTNNNNNISGLSERRFSDHISPYISRTTTINEILTNYQITPITSPLPQACVEPKFDKVCTGWPITSSLLYNAVYKGHKLACYWSETNQLTGYQTTPSISPLLQACADRKFNTIKGLLQMHNVTGKDSKDRGVLHLALGSGRFNTNQPKMAHPILNIVRLLCDHGADVNAADYSGRRPIHYCAMTMNTDAAKYLLQEHNVQINELDVENRTALYIVATNAQPDVRFSNMLIERGGKLGKRKLQPLPPKASNSQREVRNKILGIRPVS
jgi:hypothetical protein